MMPIDWLAITAAFLTGLLGSPHCAAMCGGIATGFSAMSKTHRWSEAFQVNFGRITGYTLAGGMVGLFGAGLLQWIRHPALGQGLRVGVGIVLMIAALRLLDYGGRLKFLSQSSGVIWNVLKPLHQHVLPANTVGRRIAAGIIWGWLPCGLSMTVLTAAWLQASVQNGALTMMAFGLGTLPMMIPLTWSGARLKGWIYHSKFRLLAALWIFLAGVVTIASPWLMQIPELHGILSALGCALPN